MADEVPTRVRSLMEKVLEADVTDQIAKRGQELAKAVGQATESVSQRAEVAWKDSAPQRRDAEKAARRASHDAMRWGRRTWQKDVRPGLRDLWGRRTAAMAAAGVAIPAGRDMVDDAAVRLGIRKRREARHWSAFFLGLLIGAAAGAIVALLTTPKPGREMRDDLAERARDAAERAREAAGAGEWVPLFQRPEAQNGGEERATETLPEGEPRPAIDTGQTGTPEQPS
ncbi:MAG TPA: YtxH domain-containing protein [Candidatus Limnocylindria bacterium]|nr:YtxH domain-containing protein [Candidatus Limnocylindria bacterium]